MSDALHTLIWYPTTGRLEATRFAERELPARDALLLHRRRVAPIAHGFAYAEVGAELLPAHARPPVGDAVRLLWLPLAPVRCLLAARDEAGVTRITSRSEIGEDDGLSSLLVRLEVECAWAFEEAFAAKPDESALARRLAGVEGLVRDVLQRFTVHRPFPTLSPGSAS